jgi:hypothetical protein
MVVRRIANASSKTRRSEQARDTCILPATFASVNRRADSVESDGKAIVNLIGFRTLLKLS